MTAVPANSFFGFIRHAESIADWTNSMKHGANRLAIDQVIDALSDLGRLETVDAALVAAARSLADAVDSADELTVPLAVHRRVNDLYSRK